MSESNTKYNMQVVSAAEYQVDPLRYELRKGSEPDAPPCPFGNRYDYIGYDRQEMRYVRFTKSVFKRLVKALE